MSRPVLCLSALCLTVIFAQTARAQDNSSAPPAPQVPANADPAPKRVWTNDDVTDLRADSPISTVGSPKGGPAKSGHASTGAPGQKDAKWYHDQMQKLQNQLPALDDKIAQLQAGIDGNFTGDSKTSTRPAYAKGGDWRTELAQLQKQRDDIETRISTLQDQARRAGIPANALP